MGRIFVTSVLLTALLILLVGCGEERVRERVVVKPVRIEVPVIIPCDVEVPGYPVYDYTLIHSEMPAPEVMRKLHVSVMQHRAIEDVLRGLLEKCR